MKTLLKKIAVFAAASTLALSAAASNKEFSNVITFGDSLADTGNASVLLGGPIYGPASNGPITPELIAAHYGHDATASLHLLGSQQGDNFAIGGARAIDADGDESTLDTNLPTQVNSYLAFNGGVADPDALYILAIGGNDGITAVNATMPIVTTTDKKAREEITRAARKSMDGAAKSVNEQLKKLINAGAKHIFIINSPDISNVPLLDIIVGQAASQDPIKAQELYGYAQSYAARFNVKLVDHVDQLEEQNEGVDIRIWDLFTNLNEIIANPTGFGLINANIGCTLIGVPCEGFAFYDVVHPTTDLTQIMVPSMIEMIEE